MTRSDDWSFGRVVGGSMVTRLVAALGPIAKRQGKTQHGRAGSVFRPVRSSLVPERGARQRPGSFQERLRGGRVCRRMARGFSRRSFPQPLGKPATESVESWAGGIGSRVVYALDS